MAARGYTEVSNYSFISEESARRFGLPIENHVRVLNPIAAGQELMRTSLLPGIHANIVENAKHFDEFRIFEIGHEIHKSTGKPIERPHLMAAIYSKEAAETLLELKRAAESLAPGLQIRNKRTQFLGTPRPLRRTLVAGQGSRPSQRTPPQPDRFRPRRHPRPGSDPPPGAPTRPRQLQTGPPLPYERLRPLSHRRRTRTGWQSGTPRPPIRRRPDRNRRVRPRISGHTRFPKAGRASLSGSLPAPRTAPCPQPKSPPFTTASSPDSPSSATNSERNQQNNLSVGHLAIRDLLFNQKVM